MVDKLTRSAREDEKLAEAARQLRKYLYRVRQVFDHRYSSHVHRRWWPAFVLLDDMQSHLPFLIDWLGGDEDGLLEWPESLIEFEEREGRPVRGPRAFTPDQKRVLYFNAGGRCCICRAALTQDWHADHVRPWVAGGDTTIENGQALCQPCNSRKSGRVLSVDGGE